MAADELGATSSDMMTRSCRLPNLARSMSELRATTGTMSSKNRGEGIGGCHKGPLKLRHSRPGRDCTSWVRENKQYSPYTCFPAETPLVKKGTGPPPLFMLARNKDPKPRKTKADLSAELQGLSIPGQEKTAKPGELSSPLGGSASPSKASKPKKTPQEILLDRPGWDTEHNVTFSRMNHEVQVGVREYFDKPKRRGENEGVPKIRERYAMCDRQAGWNDEPCAMGDPRPTYLNNVGPYNLGGCKDQQLPSYWRKVENWHAYSAPELALTQGITGTRSPVAGDRSLLAAMADTPATQSASFWRGYAKETSKHPESYPTEGPPKGWDGRWGITPSKDNDGMNSRMREYFSVPEGRPGLATEGKRSGKHYDPYSQVQKLKEVKA